MTLSNVTFVESYKPMILNLVYCKNCSNYAFSHMIHKLEDEYADDLKVTELDCMAACDTPPSVMLEYDFYASITPDELYDRVHEQFDHERILKEIASEA